MSAFWQRLLGVRSDARVRGRAPRPRARASSGSRRSAGRWRRVGTPGTTSSTTSSSLTRIRRSRSSSSSGRPSPRSYWGYPWHLGGSALLELVFGFLYAVTILAWSATALTFGRIPALFTAGLLLVYPAFATLYHQASSDAVFATGLALWALLLARDDAIAVGVALRRARSGHRCARADPAGESGVPAARARAAAPARRLAPENRVVGRLPRSSDRAPRRLGAPQRRALRRRHRGTRRAGMGAVPHRVHGQPDDRTGERGSVPAARPPDRSRGACEGTARKPARTAGRVPRERVELRDRPADRVVRPCARTRYGLRACSSIPRSRRFARTRDVLSWRGGHVLGVPRPAAAPRGHRAT